MSTQMIVVRRSLLIALVTSSACFIVSRPACGVQVSWVDWNSVGPATVTGVAGDVTVTYTGNLNPPPQTSGGINYWSAFPTTYTDPPNVDNPPPDSDIVRLTGGTNAISFSKPLHDPVMAIMSLGSFDNTATYDFDAPFEILNVGPGFWGNGTLEELPGNMLQGREGHGLIQFQGDFTSINWTVPIPEGWHGFTIATVPNPVFSTLLDIKPGSDSNPINLKSKGVLPVAVLSTDDFDASDIDVDTLLFGDPLLLDDGGTAGSPLRYAYEDVSEDGLLDLTLKFSISDLVDYDALGPLTMEGLLTGELFDGTRIMGTDAIRIVPGHGSGGFGGSGGGGGGGGFSVTAIPEPTAFTLAACALLGVVGYSRRRRRTVL